MLPQFRLSMVDVDEGAIGLLLEGRENGRFETVDAQQRSHDFLNRQVSPTRASHVKRRGRKLTLQESCAVGIPDVR